MTRENKISIIIAFGLLLFISMLIADYFADDPTSDIPISHPGAAIPNVPQDKTNLVSPLPPYESINQENQSGDYIHTVLEGETLRIISGYIYGDSGLAEALAEWNGLQNANALKTGQKIACPDRHALIEKTMHAEVTSAPITNEVGSETEVYTVKEGDTLSEIAQAVLGSSKNIQLLIEYNKDVMPNPDRIKVGMELTYPRLN